MKSSETTIHWLGAGLASGPGLRRLIKNGHKICVWEQDIDKAIEAISGLTGDATVREAKEGALEKAVTKGDIIVSMLPASMHATIAQICLDKEAHFVSSSYIDANMQALDNAAREKNLTFISEVGLDPGIDHLLAHLLMADYKADPCFNADNEHDFQSYCGGFPAIPNAFKYKFSWSPLGVLRALKSPARAIMEGKVTDVAKPWDAIEDYEIDLPNGAETFQSYPNRDSTPFMAEYGFEGDWNVTRFIRGTLRLDGWAKAWQPIFQTLTDQKADAQAEQELKDLSDRLWADHAYEAHEKDRVVLSVDLKVSRQGQTIWHKSMHLDAYGTSEASAMARLVSHPVSLAVESVLTGKLQAGVQPAPSNIALAGEWLSEIEALGDKVHKLDHLNMTQPSTPILDAAE